MRLQPHTDDFTAALMAQGDGDVRGTLIELINRFPAISRGATISLYLGGTRHQVDILLLHATAVRCGVPPAGLVAGQLNNGGSKGSSSEEQAMGGELVPVGAARGVEVRAACLVDADVEAEFAPSIAAEAAEEEAQKRLAVAAAQAAAQEAAAAREEEAKQAQANASASQLASRLRRSAAGVATLQAAQLERGGDALKIIECVVRCADGSRCSFSLSADAPLAALFWMVDVRATSLPKGEYALATTFPRRRFLRPVDHDDHDAQMQAVQGRPHELPTLSSEGLADAPQQAFFMEAL
jgi:hypothetical protein